MSNRIGRDCVIALAIMLFLLGGIAVSQAPPTYVGAENCVCHRNPDRGDQYTKWLKNDPHSKAYAKLLSDKAKIVAKEMGVEDPRKDHQCLRCHATAAIAKPGQISGSLSLTEGVSCEGCHGPGSNYKNLNTMQDYELAKSRGLIPLKTPEERKALCGQCHNKEMPKSVYKEIDFMKSWTGKLVHPLLREKEE